MRSTGGDLRTYSDRFGDGEAGDGEGDGYSHPDGGGWRDLRWNGDGALDDSAGDGG